MKRPVFSLTLCFQRRDQQPRVRRVQTSRVEPHICFLEGNSTFLAKSVGKTGGGVRRGEGSSVLRLWWFPLASERCKLLKGRCLLFQSSPSEPENVGSTNSVQKELGLMRRVLESRLITRDRQSAACSESIRGPGLNRSGSSG